MFKQMVAALCVAGAIACANQAQATVLYDNFNSSPATHATNIFNDRQANSFTLSSASTVTGLNFQVWLELSGTTLKSFQWGIYDASPFSGGVLLGGATVQDPTQSGPLANPYGIPNERLITLDLAPLTLAAGTYWLAIDNAAATLGRGYWEVSNGPSAVNCSQGCVPGESNSFSILGGPAARDVSIAIPEPATWAMLIMGFMGIGAMVRRQNHHRRFASAA